jgi:RNA polymerase sigma-70 factor (ECF subfamily)
MDDVSGAAGAPTQAQIGRLYRQHASFVHARCRRILRDDEAAWDATQEVFARAIASWSTFDGNSTRGTWLYRIATNHCLNVIRNEGGRRAKLDQRKGERPGAGSGPDAHGRIELLDVVRAVMQDMDEELARLAVLYYFEEMTQAEIAHEVGLSVPTVRKRLRVFVHEARKRVRKGFESQIMRAMRAETSP